MADGYLCGHCMASQIDLTRDGVVEEHKVVEADPEPCPGSGKAPAMTRHRKLTNHLRARAEEYESGDWVTWNWQDEANAVLDLLGLSR